MHKSSGLVRDEKDEVGVETWGRCEYAHLESGCGHDGVTVVCR